MIPAKQEMEVKMAEKLRITLVKSPIGAVPKHRKSKIQLITYRMKNIKLKLE